MVVVVVVVVVVPGKKNDFVDHLFSNHQCYHSEEYIEARTTIRVIS